jgi:MFS family permease
MEKEAEKPAATTPPPEAEQEEYSFFPNSTRTYLTYLLGFITTLSTLTATIYFPLIPMLSIRFSTSIQAINLTVTAYAICQAISPGIFASLADSIGRRPVLLALITLYGIASLGLALNKENYAVLITLRAVQSIGGSATPPIAYGIVADVALPSERGSMLGPLLSTCNAISAAGPVIGGAVAKSTNGSKWVFMALLILAVICLLVAGFTLPETARNVVGNGSRPAKGMGVTWMELLSSRKTELRKQMQQHGNTSAAVERWRPSRVLDALRIIFYPDAAAILWMVASSYCVYYTFQVVIPVIFDDIYGYNGLQIGLAFLPGLAGMTIGGIIAGKLVDRNYRKTAKERNIEVSQSRSGDLRDFPIEAARYRHFISAIVFQSALIIGYGWAVYYKVQAACPLILQFFICAMSTSLSHPASALLVDIFPEKSSTAYSSSQIVRCGLSAACAAVIQPLIDAVGRGWCFTMFSLFVGVSGVAVVVISRTKGMKWRQQRCDGVRTRKTTRSDTSNSGDVT